MCVAIHSLWTESYLVTEYNFLVVEVTQNHLILVEVQPLSPIHESMLKIEKLVSGEHSIVIIIHVLLKDLT